MTARLPPPVRPGARVGVAALSGAVDPERLFRGLGALADLGFEPVLAANLESKDDLFAGSDSARLEALHELADDDSLAAIFFARGGHGVLRILSDIDWTRLGRRPRAWIGYSDLTPFLAQYVARTGVAAFHGPMVAADLARGLSPAERLSLISTLAGALPIVIPARSASGCADEIEGPLAGGCLSLLTAVVGTPSAVSLAGSILALEDVDEPTYRIDRMLTHLGLSGSLAGVRGVVLGRLQGSDESDGEESSVPGRVERVTPGRPILSGLEFGHEAPNLTLPLGALARLDPRTKTLTVGASSSAR